MASLESHWPSDWHEITTMCIPAIATFLVRAAFHSTEGHPTAPQSEGISAPGSDESDESANQAERACTADAPRQPNETKKTRVLREENAASLRRLLAVSKGALARSSSSEKGAGAREVYGSARGPRASRRTSRSPYARSRRTRTESACSAASARPTSKNGCFLCSLCTRRACTG
jgi:hypothetical protein